MAKKKTSPSGSTTGAVKGSAPRRRAAAPRDEAADTSAPIGSPQAASGVSAPQATTQDPSYAEIAEAAYQRYLSRGGSHGRDFDDWLEAERELRSRR